MTPARILVVEDDRVVARDIQHQLTRIGHTVVCVTPLGEDAVRLALESQPDLVLMDIRLEGALDGVDAAQQIRDRCQVPVVFLTAYADDETLERARVTEPFGYLLKPFEDSQLRTVIEMALYKHTAERKLRESERRYAVTLASIGDAVIATDDQARVTFLNPAAEARFTLRDDGIHLPDHGPELGTHLLHRQAFRHRHRRGFYSARHMPTSQNDQGFYAIAHGGA